MKSGFVILVIYAIGFVCGCNQIENKSGDGTHFYYEGSSGTAAHRRYPIREVLEGGAPGPGYGVMQLTSPVPTREQIWNWKANIDAGMGFIAQCYNASVAHLNEHPNGVTDSMRRLGGYNRYNGGLSNRYWWWSNGPSSNNGVAEGWTKFGYKVPDSGGWPAYRDYNNDGVKDPDGNPYNIPSGPTGPNILANRAARYADDCYGLE